MASYNELNALIDAYINRNGVQAITGQILNGVLKAMVEQLGRGYTIMGAATPATDPGTPDGPECYFASTTGTYTDFDGLQVVPGELALLCYTPTDGWTKVTIYEGFQTVQATIDGNVGTPSVGVSYANGVLSFDFHNMKGNPGQDGQDGQDGDPAGFGTIGADITGGVGTPGVTVESSGPATAKNLQFHFTNLKGETGVTSVVATVDNTTGNPTCTVSLVGQQLTLAFSGLKGAQGDTGSSVDYPFTIVNNLTTDDATQALSAAQGVVLQGEITQLELKVTDLEDGETVLQQQIDAIHPIVIEGNVTNAPDEEDITTDSNDLLKFKDRPATLTNKGYKILRSDKTFASQVTDINTIYEIRYSFELEEDEEVTIPSGCELRFNGGNITGNGKLIGTYTTITSDSKCFGGDVVFAGTWANETIFTRWFNFISSEDGVTDNSVCFKQLQAVINGTKGCKVEFTKGHYQTQIIGMEPEEYVVVDDVTYPKWAMNTYQRDSRVVLNILEVPYVDINLNGSTIQAINIECPGWNMIRFNGVENAYIHDGELVGMAFPEFTYPPYVNYSGAVTQNYEFCSGLIYQVGGFCTIYNINCNHHTADGIMVGSGNWYFRVGDIRPSGTVVTAGPVDFPAKGYIVRDCEVGYCARNGVTLHSSETGQLINCHIHHVGSDAGTGVIGSDGIMGRNPRSGIDVEFEDGQGLKPIMQWDSLNIHDCGRASFAFASGQTSRMKQFSASNCYFNGLGISSTMNADGEMLFENCHFNVIPNDGLLGSTNVVYRDCFFQVTTITQTGLRIGSSIFENCRFIDEADSSTSGSFFGIYAGLAVFRDCEFTIKHEYGYIQDYTFIRCKLNFYKNNTLRCDGAEFYDCDFHNDPDDETSYSFSFSSGNYPENTRGHLILDGCSFERARGSGSDVSTYFFSMRSTPVVINRCTFNSLSFYHGGQVYNISITDSKFKYLAIFGNSQTTSGVVPVVIERSEIEQFITWLNNSIPVDIRDSRITLKTTQYVLYNVKFQNCYVLNNIARNVAAYKDVGVVALDTTFDFAYTALTDNYDLENCYIKGVVTEANYTGQKKNCVFATPYATSGATSARPTASTVGAGFTYFDTDLGKMIVSNGTAWVNMDGSPISTAYAKYVVCADEAEYNNIQNKDSGTLYLIPE